MRGLYVLAIALIISCSQNPYSDDGASDPAKLSLSFTSTGLSRNLSRDAGQVDANEIIHIKLGMTTNRDPSALDPVLSRKPLALGVNQLELDKDDVHLIAFVNNPEAAARREGGRAISSAITTIGSLNIATSGLDSLPVAAGAGQGLDLGALSAGASGFESQADPAAVSGALGYDQALLASYGSFDGMMAKLVMNPDVDGNGTYDQEEGRRWIISTLRHVSIEAGDVSADGMLSKPLESLYADLEQFRLVFWLNSLFAHPTDYSAVFLKFPPENTYVPKAGGDAVEGIHPAHDSPSEGPGGMYAQYYFNLSDAIASPAPPYAGDYALRIGADEYSFNDLDFLGTTQESYEGFLIPVSTFTFNQSDILQKVSWRWVVLRNGRYDTPLPGEVKLKMMQFYYYMPGFFLQPDEERYHEDGEADVSSYGITRSGLGSAIDCDYWDRAGNDYKFHNGL